MSGERRDDQVEDSGDKDGVGRYGSSNQVVEMVIRWTVAGGRTSLKNGNWAWLPSADDGAGHPEESNASGLVGFYHILQRRTSFGEGANH